MSNKINRRDFLKVLSAASLGEPRLRRKTFSRKDEKNRAL
jgi:hypothetical protein